MKVRKNKFGKWETAAHNKMLNGEDIWYNMPVQFQKGQEPLKDQIEIEPKKWWLSCYMGKGYSSEGMAVDVAKPKIFVAEWEEVIQKDNFQAETYTEYKGEDKGKDLVIDTEELPFY